MQLLMDERKEIDRARRKSKGEEGGGGTRRRRRSVCIFLTIRQQRSKTYGSFLKSMATCSRTGLRVLQ
jgi:hypothetical protein